MPTKTVKDIMVPLSQYVVVSEEATIRDVLEKIRQSHAGMPEDMYYHRAALVRNEAGDIVGKLGYLGILEALDPEYGDLDKMKALAGSGITKQDMHRDMRQLGLWDKKLPLIKQRAAEKSVKEVMSPFEAHIEEDGSMAKAMHLMAQLQVLSLLTTDEEDHITGIVRLSDLFEAVTDYVITDN